jgi:hypothetical protein
VVGEALALSGRLELAVPCIPDGPVTPRARRHAYEPRNAVRVDVVALRHEGTDDVLGFLEGTVRLLSNRAHLEGLIRAFMICVPLRRVRRVQYRRHRREPHRSLAVRRDARGPDAKDEPRAGVGIGRFPPPRDDLHISLGNLR